MTEEEVQDAIASVAKAPKSEVPAEELMRRIELLGAVIDEARALGLDEDEHVDRWAAANPHLVPTLDVVVEKEEPQDPV